MGAILAIARNDWRLILRDRQALIWMFLMPLLFIFVFGNLGGGSGGDRRREVPVLVEDERFLGDVIFRGMEDENWAPYRVSRDDSAFATLSLYVLIPSRFTESVLSGEGAVVLVVEEEGASMRRREGYAMCARKASIRALANLFEIPDSLRTTLGDEELRPVYDSLAARPDGITLVSRLAEGAKELPDGYLQSVPGNLIMFVLIVALTSGAGNIAAEKSIGRLRRLGAAPIARHQLFLGKLLGYTFVALTQIAFLVAFSTIVLRIDWGGEPLGLGLTLVLFALVASSIGVFLGLLVGKPETAAWVGVLTTLVMASLGGCWWPLEIVPPAMRAVGHLFPTTWALESIFDLAAYGKSTIEIVPKLLILAGYTTIFSFVGSKLLRFDR